MNTTDATRQEIEIYAQELIEEIGLSTSFLSDLKNGDDWSFVVKLHALVEAAMTQALAVQIGKSNATDFFARLELNNAKTGKVAFARMFIELDTDDLRFLRNFSELRNEFVHDVRRVSVNLHDYFSALTLVKQRSFITAFGYTENGHSSKAEMNDNLIHQHRKSLRSIILRSTVFFLAILQAQSKIKRSVDETNNLKIRLGEAVKSSSLFA